MAKKSSIEKNKRRRKLVSKYAGKRKRLLGEDDLAAVTRGTDARAPVQVPFAPAQPLRGDGTLAGRLPQSEDVAHRDARDGLERAHPRPR